MGLADWLNELLGGGVDDRSAERGSSGAADGGGATSSSRTGEAAARANQRQETGGSAGEGSDGSAGTTSDETPSSIELSEDEPPTEAAELLVDQATAKGFDLDYSAASLARLDELLEALPDEGIESAAPTFGAYLGEVFVRSYDGEWTNHEEIGWTVELPVRDEDGEETDAVETLAIGRVVQACLAAEVAFAQVHDLTAARIGADATALAEEPYPSGVPAPTLEHGPATDEAPEHLVEEYKEAAAELVDGWPEHDLDYTPDSLDRLDDVVEEVYDLDEVDDEEADEEEADDEEADGEAENETEDSETADEEGDDEGDETEAGDADDTDADDEADANDGPVVPAGPDLHVTEGQETAAFAGYVGEVFVQNYDAEWRRAGEAPVLVVRGETATAEVDPIQLVSRAFEGELTFTEVREGLVEDAGLEPAE